MNKILTIISSNSHANKLIPLIKKFKKDKNNEIVVVTFNNDVEKKLEDGGINYKNPEDFINPQELNDIRMKAFSWIKEWPNFIVEKNKNFKDYVAYKKISLWWFVEIWFYYAKMFHFYSIEEIMRNVLILSQIIKKENPAKILVVDDKSLISKIIITIASFKKIEMQISYDLFSSFKYKIFRSIIPFTIKFFKDFKILLRQFSAVSLPPYKNPDLKKNRILMLTHPTYIQPSFNPITKEPIKEDIVLGPVIRKLKRDKKNKIILVDTDPFPTLRVNFLFNKNYKHLETYLTKEIKEKAFRETERLLKKWDKLRKNVNFKKSLILFGIPIYGLLEDKLRELFHRKFKEAILYIELMNHAIKLEKPNIIVIVDEYGLYGKAVIVASKLNHILTVAIQHGFIWPYNFAWFHKKGEISNSGKISTRYCPIPDKTLVGGNYFKNVLIKYGLYPPNSVLVTGHSKYDIIVYSDELYKKERIYKKLNIDPNKKLIVFISQPYLWTTGLNEIIYRNFFQAIKDFHNIQTVIKLHPNEYTKSLHKRIANQFGVNVILVKNINLFELLNACDIMMTVASTVAFEAMVLNKPVIFVNPKHEEIGLPFETGSAVLVANNSNEILSSINKIFSDKKIRKKLDSYRKKVIYDYAYKIDGQASDRIIKIIEHTINKK